MNICLATSTYLPLVGGREIVVHNLATALTELGHHVYVVTPRPSNCKIADNYPYKVIRFGFKGYGRLRLPFVLAIGTLAYVVKRYRIDVIHVHNVFTPGSWAFYYSKTNPSVPIIGTPHGDDVQITIEIQDGVRLDPRSDKIVRRNLNGFTYVTAISQSLRDDLYPLVTQKERIIDVPNGVWIKKYQQETRIAQVRERFGIPADSVVVISIGRNHPRKGFEYGILALSLLKKAGFNIVYLLVGRAMEPVVEMAQQLDVSDCLVTPGQIDSETVVQLLQASDIYLSTSIVESFGIATLEAMGAGLPCVVTDIAGSRDLVLPEFGFLVKPKDADQIARTLKWLIEEPNARRDMGEKARIEATQYEWSKIADRYVDVYRRAIKG